MKSFRYGKLNNRIFKNPIIFNLKFRKEKQELVNKVNVLMLVFSTFVYELVVRYQCVKVCSVETQWNHSPLSK